MAHDVAKRAFKFRFYPTDEQTAELIRMFGCVRLVYNKALEARTEAWSQESRRVNYVESSALLTDWKKTEEFAFLNEVSSVPLQRALRHLQGAFAGFWEKRAEHPRFKSLKKSKLSAEYTRSAFTFRDGALRLAKMAEPLDIIWSRPLPDGAEPTTVKVARVHARITDRRRDHMHKLTTRLVRENQAIVIEDLSVRNLLGNHRLARAISDAAWSEPRTRPQYKCAWYGRELVVVDQFYPGSEICAACGHRIAALPLNVREWTCAGCGAVHDRDVNAARNLEAAGLAVIACGAGVSPQRSNPRRRSAVKQESQPATVGIPPH